MPIIKNLILKGIKKDQYEKYLELIPELKSEKNEKLVMITLTIIAAIILGVFAINPTLSTITNLQKQVDDSKFFESKLSEKITNLSNLNQQYQNIQNDLPLVFDAVPKNSDIATLAATLQSITNNSKVKLINLQIQKAEISKKAVSSKEYSTYEFSATCEGNYQDLILFLNNSINFQRILTINSISVVKSTTSTGIALQISISGNAYFKP